MTQDEKLEMLGPLMNEIGQEVVQLTGGQRDGIFLYVEVGDRWLSPNLYKAEGDIVRSYDDSELLTDLIWEAWYAEPEGKNLRWSVMEYFIADGRFHVSLRYPEEVDVEVYDHDDLRRGAALRKRFGDKPVVYPPPPETAIELKLKD